MPQVTVALGERSYLVHVQAGAVARVAEFLPKGAAPARALVVSDANVAPLYAGPVLDSLRKAGVPAALSVMPPGEGEKTLARVEALYHEMVDAGLDRQSLVVALGGGVVGDVAGFAAATYMRGIALLQVPTTVVAQVDSSIGGKTGVDLPEGKNLVGAFHQPVAVVIDPETLRSLPEREVRAGLAEVVKHGVIQDAAYFGFLEREGRRLLQMSAKTAERVITRSVEIKSAVVSADERELGLRAILNYGHTVGHALEVVTGYRKYLHGEAIAVGMAAAANLSLSSGLCDRETADRITGLLSALGLPTAPESVRAGKILAVLSRDKKALAGRARFVLPRRIGSVEIVDDLSDEVLEKGLLMTGFIR